jgi:hypothetical protein
MTRDGVITLAWITGALLMLLAALLGWVEAIKWIIEALA